VNKTLATVMHDGNISVRFSSFFLELMTDFYIGIIMAKLVYRSLFTVRDRKITSSSVNINTRETFFTVLLNELTSTSAYKIYMIQNNITSYAEFLFISFTSKNYEVV